MIQKIIALSVCFILIGLVAVAQPTFSLNNASGTYNVNQQIIAKTFVDDFTDITYFKLQIIWNPAVLHLDSISNFNLPYLDISKFQFTQVEQGKLIVEWRDISGQGVTIPTRSINDGISIFNLFFSIEPTTIIEESQITIPAHLAILNRKAISNNIGLFAENATVNINTIQDVLCLSDEGTFENQVIVNNTSSKLQGQWDELNKVREFNGFNYAQPDAKGEVEYWVISPQMELSRTTLRDLALNFKAEHATNIRATPIFDGMITTSVLNVTGFVENQVVESPNDIASICANIAHEYMRDLEIKLICPSGQSVILHEYPGRASARTILLGKPQVSDPGIGFNYCWSPTATRGTFIEYSKNTQLGSPPTMPEGTYNAYQPFSNLLGCPLNGAWKLEINDLWFFDEGYLFNWDMQFNDTIPQQDSSFYIGNNLELYWSSDYQVNNNPNLATWHPLDTLFSKDENFNRDVSLDLLASSIDTARFHIAFKYKAKDNYSLWRLRDIRIQANDCRYRTLKLKGEQPFTVCNNDGVVFDIVAEAFTNVAKFEHQFRFDTTRLEFVNVIEKGLRDMTVWVEGDMANVSWTTEDNDFELYDNSALYALVFTSKQTLLDGDTLVVLDTLSSEMLSFSGQAIPFEYSGAAYIEPDFKDSFVPIITFCPKDIAIQTPDNQASVYWNSPLGYDNCELIITSNYEPSDTFPIGTTKVVYEFKDNSSNTAICSFNVTVKQSIPDITTLEAVLCGNNNIFIWEPLENVVSYTIEITINSVRKEVYDVSTYFFIKALNIPNNAVVEVRLAALFSDGLQSPFSESIRLIKTCNGAETPQINNFLYPNPVTSQLFIESSVPVTQLRISDQFGRLIESHASVAAPIDVSHLQNGIYQVTLFFEDGEIKVKTIIKL